MHHLLRVSCACAVLAAFVQAGHAQTREATVKPATATRAGIEPDEIDVQQGQQKTRPPRAPATPASGATLLAPKSGSGEPPKYETADCGTKEKPITCCTKGDGPGASCDLFILLCNEGGGTGKGGAGDAICVH